MPARRPRVLLLRRAGRGALALTAFLTLAPATASAALPESLTMDLRQATGRFVGVSSTSTLLPSAEPYVAEVAGTMSLWNVRSWSARSFTTCLTPESAPMFPSPGTVSGPVGVDPEQRFGLVWPRRRGACPLVPSRNGNFQISTGGPFRHPDPLPSSDPANHRYVYPLDGQGRAVGLRFFDPAAADNYGQFRVIVRAPASADCSGEGAARLGFGDEAACLAYVAQKAGQTPAGSGGGGGAGSGAPPSTLAGTSAQPVLIDADGGVAAAIANSVCRSRRQFVIRLKERRSDPIKRASVRLGGKRIRLKRRTKDRRLVGTVSLARRPKGVFSVRIDVVYRSGRKGSSVRRYRTCVFKPGKQSRSLPVLDLR